MLEVNIMLCIEISYEVYPKLVEVDSTLVNTNDVHFVNVLVYKKVVGIEDDLRTNILDVS